jgi:hypothetical protein
MKTTSEVIAGDVFDSSGSRNGDTLDSLLTVSGERPTVGGKWNPSEIEF